MTDPPAPPPARSALAKLRRRKVVQWSLAYVAVVWGLLQGLEFAVTTFQWSESVTRVAAILAAIGLPITVTLAWYHGDRGQQRVTRIEVAILAALLAVGVVLIRHAAPSPVRTAAPVVSAPAGSPATARLDRHRIAILPFDNLGADPANAAFVGGVHDTLITLVAKVPGLSVISRSSVLQFADRHPTIRDVANALNVGAVLEGSVQRAGDRLRVQAQLIDAVTDTHLWAETYDRRADDLFAVQSEIAQAVAEQLRIRLTQNDVQRITTDMTKKPEAYEHYVLGRNFMAQQKWSEAIHELTMAVTADPDFAPAYAAIGMSRTWMAFFAPETRADNLPLAKAAIDRARQLYPTLPDGHLARALYLYRGEQDVDRAAAEFEQAAAGLPNDATAHLYFGYLRRWQGRLEEAAALFRRAAELDPRGDAAGAYVLALVALGRREEAARAIAAAQAAHPEDVVMKLWPGDLAFNFDCDLHTLEDVVQKVDALHPDHPYVLDERATLASTTGDSAGAVDAATRLAMVSDPSEPEFGFDIGYAYLVGKRREESQRRLRQSLNLRLERAAAQPPGEARANEEAWVAVHYALLGDRGKAVEYARRVESEPRGSGPGPDRQETLYLSAAALAHSGQSDAAVARIKAYLTTPGFYQPAALWCNPLLAPLRTDPRYRALMAQHGVDVSIDPYRRETWPKKSGAVSTTGP